MAGSKEKSDEKAARERLKKRVLADYHKNGKKPKELSETYKVPVNTVNTWIKREKKKVQNGSLKGSLEHGSDSSDEPFDNGSSEPKKKKHIGAPYGNVNAIGNKGGGQPGNQNALKHGGFSKLILQHVTEEEKELLALEDDDLESMILSEIKILTLQEHRLLTQLNNFSDPEKKLVVESVQRSERKRTFENKEEERLYKKKVEEKVQNGEQLPGKSYDLITRSEATYKAIETILNALSRVQAQKRLNLQTLKEIRKDRGDTGMPSVVDDWVAAVMEADGRDDE